MASSYIAYGDPNQTPQSASQSPALVSETSASLRDRKKKQQQPRQLLSCTKCRERKVKCDRTKPCSACCARGLPKECHFVLGEGTEFGPIQQSLELRKLRAENQRLKERLIAAKLSLSDDSEDDDGSSTGKSGPNNRRAGNRQKRFRTNDHTDSLYFGSPGLANLTSDFATLQVEPKSLAFTMPRGADMYAGHVSMYPFPALWQATTATEGLLQCLDPRESLLSYMDTFSSKAVGFAFPFLPEELTHKEVEHFLQDAEQNAVMYPDSLALILAGAALGMQLGGEGEDAKNREDRLRRGDVFIAGAMQALRTSGFMSRPTLRSLQALLIVGPYLTNSGRFLDAWSLFGLTVRLAQSIGLHRNPKYLDPVPELRECTIRSTIWWWMLHTDQLYSMTLGRPLGISGIGDCSPAEPLTTNPAVLRMGEFVDQLTLLGRQILSSNQLTDAKIDIFTDRLIALWDTMPETLQFNDSWSNSEVHLPEYPLCATAAVHYCKIHSYIILLNRQRIENTRETPEFSSPSPKSFNTVPVGQGYLDLPLLRPHAVPRGRSMVIQSSMALLDAFIYFFRRVPIALIDWTTGQQAFNACLILLLDALETGDTHHIGKVEQAYAIFVQLDKDRLHQISEMAVTRISEGLLRLRDAIERKTVTPTSTNSFGGGDITREQSSIRHHSESGLESGVAARGFYHESVMGNTGMFLLEDPGLQSGRIASTSSSSRGPSHPATPPDQPAKANPIPQIAQRRHSTQPIQRNPHMQQTYPHQQPLMYQHTSTQPLPAAYNFPSQQGPPYIVGFHPHLLPRRDSATSNSGHTSTQIGDSLSPQMPGSGPYGPPAMRPPPPRYPTSVVYQQACMELQTPQQMSQQERQAMGVQQMNPGQAMPQGQLFPPYPPR